MSTTIIHTSGGDDYVWDTSGEPHPISSIQEETAGRPNPAGYTPRVQRIAKEAKIPSAYMARAVTSSDGMAKVTINSGNKKTGPTLATHTPNASCPTGRNNPSGYRCPWLGNGCYAEHGPQWITTKSLNQAAGYSMATGLASYTPEDVARSEAEALQAAHDPWTKYRLNTACRLHVVGDCVTPESARIVSSAVDPYVTGLEGALVKKVQGASNVWVYTHGWKDVSRDDWHPDISVLASVDAIGGTQFLQALEEAHSRGYAIASVVPMYVQQAGKRSGAAFRLRNGFTILPCPHEVGVTVPEGEHIVCTECGWCLREKWLYKNRYVIAFAPHGAKARSVSESLMTKDEFASLVE